MKQWDMGEEKLANPDTDKDRKSVFLGGSGGVVETSACGIIGKLRSSELAR